MVQQQLPLLGLRVVHTVAAAAQAVAVVAPEVPVAQVAVLPEVLLARASHLHSLELPQPMVPVVLVEWEAYQALSRDRLPREMVVEAEAL